MVCRVLDERNRFRIFWDFYLFFCGLHQIFAPQKVNLGFTENRLVEIDYRCHLAYENTFPGISHCVGCARKVDQKNLMTLLVRNCMQSCGES